MDARIKEYRGRAEEVRRKAAALAIPSIREEMRKIAEQYEELAARLEREEWRGS